MSTISVSNNTVTSIGTILSIDMKPMWMKNKLIDDIKERMRLQNLSVQRDFLNMCVTKGLAPADIQCLAKRTIK